MQVSHYETKSTNEDESDESRSRGGLRNPLRQRRREKEKRLCAGVF